MGTLSLLTEPCLSHHPSESRSTVFLEPYSFVLNWPLASLTRCPLACARSASEKTRGFGTRLKICLQIFQQLILKLLVFSNV